jgi:hypothetical protein
VGRTLLRYTDRVFSAFTRAMSPGRVSPWVRRIVVPRVLPRLLESQWPRIVAFRFVSELRIRYRRSPIVEEGEPRLHSGPRAGDRLPDAALTIDGRAVTLQRAVIGPHLTLVLCGDAEAWEAERLTRLVERFSGLLKTRHLALRALPGELACGKDTLAMLGAASTPGAQRSTWSARTDTSPSDAAAASSLR